MSKVTFKVGDKVRVVRYDYGSPAQLGAVGVVLDKNTIPAVQFGVDVLDVYQDQLELVRATQAPRLRTLPDGSAERKQYPLFTGPVLYFPAALAAVAKLCKDGNDKHNPGEPMHHARGKSDDHADTILRHLLDAHEADGRDAGGTPHLVNAAWRCLALLQEWLEKHDGAPRAPGASPEGSEEKP